MAAVRFTLSPEHCARVHDALSCLAKFSELVSLEARYGQVGHIYLHYRSWRA